MGDHAVGGEMGRAAQLYWDMRAPSQQEALAVLDKICGSHRNRDAEFESEDPARPGYLHPDYDYYTDPQGPLGRLIAIAFEAKPEEMVEETDDGESPWLDGPYRRFRDRYKFC